MNTSPLQIVRHSPVIEWVMYQGERIGVISVPNPGRPEQYHAQFVAPTGETFPFPVRANRTHTLSDFLRAAAEFRYESHPVLLRPGRGDDAGWTNVHCPTCHQYGGLGGSFYPSMAEAIANLSSGHWKTVGHSARRVTEPIVLPPAPRPMLTIDPRFMPTAG